MSNPEFAHQPERIIIKSDSDTVQLMQLVSQDADGYFGLIADNPDHLRQFGDTTADKYPNAEAVRESIEQPTNPNKLRFGIWDQDVMVGSINLTPEDDHKAEIGYWIGSEHTGHAYAARGLFLLADYALAKLGYQEVYCDIVIGNEASRRTVEKSDFQFTGEFIDGGTIKRRFSLKKLLN